MMVDQIVVDASSSVVVSSRSEVARKAAQARWNQKNQERAKTCANSQGLVAADIDVPFHKTAAWFMSVFHAEEYASTLLAAPCKSPDLVRCHMGQQLFKAVNQQGANLALAKQLGVDAKTLTRKLRLLATITCVSQRVLAGDDIL